MRHGIRISPRTKVIGFKYRTALPQNIIFSMDADKELHHELATEAGIRYDNHQTFALTQENGEKIIILFSDNFMAIGTKIRIGAW